MTSISPNAAGFATRFTRAEPAPRTFGGARSISSSSSAAWRMERRSRYAAAFVASVLGSSEARQFLMSDSVTSDRGISPNTGRTRVASSDR